MKKYIVLLFLGFIIANASLTGDWCGTIPALKDYRQGKGRQRPTLSGPVEYIDRPLFRVHFTRQGADRVSLAYAESVASYIQYCWIKQIDSLGWAAPAPDYGLGGDNRYDAYITALPSGIAGVCYAEYGYANPYPDGACSHIRISNTLYIYGFLKTVCAHEFNHSLQMRYSDWEDIWWYENTATWMSDICYDDLNDYVRYLTSAPNPLNNPEYPIDTFEGLYQYAGAIWAMFLEDYYSVNCPRQIWHRQGIIAGPNTISAFNYVLTNQYGSNLQTALKKYALWRFFTNVRADTANYFKEGHLYPLVRFQQSINSYPTNGNQLTYKPQGPGGANYLQFTNGGGKFFASFDGQDGYQWTSYIIGYRVGQPSLVYEYSLNSQAAGSDSFDWQNRDYFTMIPVVTQWSPSTGQLNFTYSANLRIGRDAGITRLTGFPSLADTGMVINPQALIRNYGLYSENFPVKLNVGSFYSKTININLNSGDSVVVTFPTCTLKVRGYHTYACSTLLTNDERNSNNSISDRIFVRVKDIGTVTILAPTGNIAQGSLIQPRVRLKNYGNVREMFDVDFSIGSWQVTQRFSLTEGLEHDFTFDSIFQATVTGNLLVKCSTKLDGDVNPNNNRVVSNCYVNPVTITEEQSSFLNNIYIPSIISLNKPIILSRVTIIGRVEVEIFNILGKNIYREVFKNRAIIINNHFANGCYIIRLKSDNQIIITKSIMIGK